VKLLEYIATGIQNIAFCVKKRNTTPKKSLPPTPVDPRCLPRCWVRVCLT